VSICGALAWPTLLTAGREQCLLVARQVKRSVTWLNSTNPARRSRRLGSTRVKEGDGGSGFEVTCVEGQHFPPTRSGKGARYELVRGATHSHKRSELGSGDK
jgi:hypothetical protein